MNIDNLSDYGFIFEFSFNIGMLSFIKDEVDNKRAIIGKGYIEYLESILKKREFLGVNIYNVYTSSIIDENIKKTMENNIDYIIIKGFISGKNFVREFIRSKVGKRNYKIEYLQVNFVDPFNIQHSNKTYEYYKRCLEKQVGGNLSKNGFEQLSQKGEFLKADSIICISVRNKNYIGVIDNSIHIKNISKNYSQIQNIKDNYKNNIYKKRSKSCFTNLNIDASGYIDLNINEYFSKCLTIFNDKNKGLYKSIQAGSYANSFIKYMIDNKVLEKEHIESISLIGYTDEDFTSINIGKYDLENIDYKNNELLKVFSESYKNTRSDDNNLDKIYKNVLRNFGRSFGYEYYKEIIEIKDGIDTLKINNRYSSYKDDVGDYQNTAGEYLYNGKYKNFRDCHALEINKALKDKQQNIIFLTGNPGIGKTTAIKDYLKNEESYIFIYVSPRVQVNKDIEQKFMDSNDNFYCDDLVCLNANSNDETYIDSKIVDVVNFKSNNNSRFENIKEPIMFLDGNREKLGKYSKECYKNISQRKFTDKCKNVKGVLNRLSNSINYIVDRDLSRKIVATASIQSLKKNKCEKSTIEHLENIFKSVKTKNNGIDVDEFRKFAQKYKNVFFMIDEISGDKSGVEFLNSVNYIIYDEMYNKLSEDDKKLVNFKVIVADASITSEDIINKHLVGTQKSENNKIYYKKVENNENQLPLVTKEFTFNKRYKSIYINTNSYPAKNLNIEYEVIHNTVCIDNNKINTNELKDIINEKIVKDCILDIKNHKQIIIYVQDKKRLVDIENLLSCEYKKRYNNEIENYRDYIIINSNLSDKEKDKVLKYKDDVKFVFMTSSASRGISFSNTTKIILDMPTYDIEMNLMEILQLIYRGRGDTYIDENIDKYVKFYIQNNIFYTKQDDDFNRKKSIMKSIISLMSIMLIIKISIETRLKGYGNIGKNKCMIIPLGGKGVDKLDYLGIDMICDINKRLKKELYEVNHKRGNPSIVQSLENIFSKVSVETKNNIFNKSFRDINSIYKNFKQRINYGIYNLLEFNPFKESYILGEFMIFKVTNEINISMHLFNENFKYEIQNNNLSDKIYALSKNNELTETLRNDLLKIYNLFVHFTKQESDYMDYFNKSKGENRYIAIPIIYILYVNRFSEYFKSDEGEEHLKDIMKNYIKSYYDADSILPITNVYEDIPFISFKSSNLEDIRAMSFDDKYLCCSSDINLISLLMMK